LGLEGEGLLGRVRYFSPHKKYPSTWFVASVKARELFIGCITSHSLIGWDLRSQRLVPGIEILPVILSFLMQPEVKGFFQQNAKT